MKNVLLIVGVVCLVVCVLALAFAALNGFGYRVVLDGSNELYHRMHQRAIVSLVVGVVFALIGVGSLILRAKK